MIYEFFECSTNIPTCGLLLKYDTHKRIMPGCSKYGTHSLDLASSVSLISIKKKLKDFLS